MSRTIYNIKCSNQNSLESKMIPAWFNFTDIIFTIITMIVFRSIGKIVERLQLEKEVFKLAVTFFELH